MSDRGVKNLDNEIEELFSSLHFKGTKRPIKVRAASGDAEAQYQLGLKTASTVEGRKLLCLAANQGHGGAQSYMGYSLAGQNRYVLASMWYRLAVSSGYAHAAVANKQIIDKMSFGQVAEGDRLARNWRPNPGSCLENSER
jgi:hypothetical protein